MSTSRSAIRAVLSRTSVTMWAITSGIQSHVVKSCSFRIARFEARKSRTEVRSASPDTTESEIAAKAERPVARATNQNARSSNAANYARLSDEGPPARSGGCSMREHLIGEGTRAPCVARARRLHHTGEHQLDPERFGSLANDYDLAAAGPGADSREGHRARSAGRVSRAVRGLRHHARRSRSPGPAGRGSGLACRSVSGRTPLRDASRVGARPGRRRHRR